MKRLLLSSSLIGFVLGLIAFAVGLALVYPPAGLIGAGVVLMAVSIFEPGGKP